MARLRHSRSICSGWSLTERLYNATIRNILYSRMVWALSAADAGDFFTRPPRSPKYCPSQNFEWLMRRRAVLCWVGICPLTKVNDPYHLRWLGHVLRMPAHHLPFVLFSNFRGTAGRCNAVIRLWLGVEVLKIWLCFGRPLIFATFSKGQRENCRWSGDDERHNQESKTEANTVRGL